MSHDESKRRVLARRARFMAAAGIAGAALSATSLARAEEDGAAPDGSLYVEAGVRADGGDGDDDLEGGAPPAPCLSMPAPDPQPCLSSCAATPNVSSAPIAPLVVATGAAIAAMRRRKKKR